MSDTQFHDYNQIQQSQIPPAYVPPKTGISNNIIIALIVVTIVFGGVIVGALVWSDNNQNIIAQALPSASADISSKPSEQQTPESQQKSGVDPVDTSQSKIPYASGVKAIYDFDTLLDSLLQAERIDLKDKVEGTIVNCTVTASYFGTRRGANATGQILTYANTIQLNPNCDKSGIVKTYSRTYWVDGEIYTQSYEGGPFVKKDSLDTYTEKSHPNVYLRQYFGQNSTMKITEVTPFSGDALYTVDFSTKEITGSAVFSIDGRTRHITQILYEAKPQTGTGIDGKMKGQINVTWIGPEDNYPIVVPK